MSRLGRRVLAAELGSERQGDAMSGPVTGTGGSLVLVLASSVRVLLADLAISNGLFPGLAGVVKMLAGEVGPAGDPDQRAAARQDRHRQGP